MTIRVTGQTIRPVLLLTLFSAAPVTAGAQEESVPKMVSIGPTGSILEQLQYLAEHWPEQHAVAVVEAAEGPECSARRDDGPRYCLLEVRPVELILVRWLRRDPPGPGASFRLHYWYRPSVGELEIARGDRLMAFLIPARQRGVFVATVVMRGTDEIADFVRRAAGEAMQ
jgi:hypothetical protein